MPFNKFVVNHPRHHRERCLFEITRLSGECWRPVLSNGFPNVALRYWPVLVFAVDPCLQVRLIFVKRAETIDKGPYAVIIRAKIVWSVRVHPNAGLVHMIVDITP